MPKKNCSPNGLKQMRTVLLYASIAYGVLAINLVAHDIDPLTTAALSAQRGEASVQLARRGQDDSQTGSQWQRMRRLLRESH